MARTKETQDQSGEGGKVVRCVAVDAHLRLLRTSPEYRWARREVGREIDAWVERYAGEGLRTGLIRIPVVVHVVYNTPEQNISDAQIQSQIDVLNRDYRRLNTDAGDTPPAFAGVAADARIEFALAVRGPGCLPTNGITRTSTAVTSWNVPGEGMKLAATGGADQWDPDQYLNFWVVNYESPWLGYGTFPGMPANIQGVVVHCQAFGTTGSLIPGAHLGRTATHEVGHYLDLHHIWGDDLGACSGSDLVADTPNQADSSPFSADSCRVFPAVSCGNAPDGDMFMNYMDYSGDQCMNLFTAGQSVRMDAALMTQRTSLLASPALVAPTGVPGPDLWSKDTSDDMGVEPDVSTQPMYISDDIWVRTGNDGLVHQDHQNPEYRPPGSMPNTVYVRVRNRSCGGSQSGTVRLYWAKASSGLSWPAPWDGSVTAPALMGSPIGSAPVSVSGGDEQIVAFPWLPPNPADYAVFGADEHHFCLLSRIETDTAAPYGMTSPETSDLYANVASNNNIVWKNIEVVDDVPGGGRTGFTFGSFGDKVGDARLRFSLVEEKPSLLDWGRIYVELPAELAGRARQQEKSGLEWVSDTTAVLSRRVVELQLGGVEPGSLYAIGVRFVPDDGVELGARVLGVDAQQFDGDKLVGGVRFLLRTKVARAGDGCGCGPENGPLDGGNWIPQGCRSGCSC